jgi:hypothetical protein
MLWLPDEVITITWKFWHDHRQVVDAWIRQRRNEDFLFWAQFDKYSVSLNTSSLGATPDAILRLLDELEANRQSRRKAWATLQRSRKFLEANGTRVSSPDDRSFESEGEVIETGLRRTIEGRDMVMRSLIGAVYRLRDATVVAEKNDFGNAPQNLYRELERAENLVGPS